MPSDLSRPSTEPTSSQSSADATDQRRAADGRTYFLGRYRVVDEIGVGGMASVHLARMDGPGGFQKWVAIKRIHPHLVEDETFVNMFIDEARVAARISHPNVAAVFELGKHEDTYWIAMEYLHGEPLREVMRKTEEIGQPMPPEVACRVIADAAEGLHAAHELAGKNGEKLGLVHRDVTPHNLFVTYDGSTKVVDFGIAKFASRIADTRAGTLKGKVAYMSPEQVAGETLDRRTDVFALGVVLWELTTGQRLFRMESDLDTMAKVQECSVPRPSTIVRGYPIDLEKIVMKALARNKNERYRTARELSRALQSLLMRRGLFVAADEVSAYMQSVFADRISKREAHLRWAAEVTQTIDVEKLNDLSAPPWPGAEGSLVTFNSEVQPSNPAKHPPRPAAGMRPPTPGPLPVPTPPPLAPGHRSAWPRPVLHSSVSSEEDPTATARTRSSRTAPNPGRPRAPSSFDDDFDDVGDTIVTNAETELRTIAEPPAVAILAHPHPLLRPSMSSEAALEPVQTDHGAPPHGPADMQRLFAPPVRHEQRTVTRRALRRRIPAWGVAAGSAVLGLFAAGLVAFAIKHVGRQPLDAAHGADSATGSRADSHGPVIFVSTRPGPFRAARSAFVSAISAPSLALPAGTAGAAGTDTSSATSPRNPLPAGSPRQAWPTSQSTGGGPSGTLKVICLPVCDQVIDNGNALGPSPVVRRNVSVGSHRVKLMWGDASKVVSTIVLADQTSFVRESRP